MSTVTRCQICDVGDDNLISNDRDVLVCNDCKKNVEYCSSCDEPCDKHDLTSLEDGDDVCGSCLDSSYFKCVCCDIYKKNRDSNNTDDGLVCDGCYENYCSCYSCGYTSHEDNMFSVDDECYCQSCYDDMICCDNCGSYTSSPIDTDDGVLCPSCSKVDARPELPPMCNGGYLGTRCFGIELEFDNVYENKSSWKQVGDGSLSSSGGEFLSGPLRGEDGINNVNTNVKKIKGNIRRNCGFHLHIDMTSEEMSNVKNVVMTAIGMEDYIFSLVSKSRRDNRYCMKLKDRLSDLINSNLDNWTYYEGYNKNITADKYNDKRYEWINSHSYFYRGTLEIRVHQGTGNPEKVLRWAELWLKIADWAIKQEPNFIRMHCISPDFTQRVLSSIGLRDSTKEYFNHRIKLLSSGRDDESED